MRFPHSSQSVPRTINGVDQPVEVTFIGDDPELADIYRLKLQLDGYAVTLVTTEQLRSGTATLRTRDIVYLDLGLLNPAGLATHRRLRGQPGTKHVPIVLLSTRLAREGFATGLKLGVHDFFISSDAARPEGFWNEDPAVMLAWH